MEVFFSAHFVLFIISTIFHQASPTTCKVKPIPADRTLPACEGGIVGIDPEEFDKFLGRGKNSGIHEAQLDKYYGEHKLNHSGHPRVFPVCITTDNPIFSQDEHLDPWIENLEKLTEALYAGFRSSHGQRFHQFDKETDLIRDNNTDRWIDSVELSRINIGVAGYVNLRNWFHVTIKVNPDKFPNGIQGVLVHHISGPLGLPLAEFNLDFPCQDEDNATEGHLIHCDFRPRVSIRHPQVYFGGGSGKSSSEFHFHVRYTHASCVDISYIQFIVIPVKKFKVGMRREAEWQAYLSQVFAINSPNGMDARNGLPYPVYESYRDKMWCHLNSDTELQEKLTGKPQGQSDKNYDPLVWAVYPDLLRILPNYEYEYCLLGEYKTGRDETRMECPPGPFQCDVSFRDMKFKDIRKERSSWLHNEKENNEQCTPCTEAATQELYKTVAPKPCKYDVNDMMDANDAWETVVYKRKHLLLTFLVYFIIIPVANLLARFFKEFPQKAWLGVQHWIFWHVLLHLISIIFTWVSIGWLAMGSDLDNLFPKCTLAGKFLTTEEEDECESLRKVSISHQVLAWIVVFLQHAHIFTGCERSKNPDRRAQQTMVHACGGYATYVISIITALVANPTCSKDVYTALICYAIVYCIAFVSFTAIEVQIDGFIEISPRRSHFPVVEQILLEHDDSYHIEQFHQCKKYILGMTIGGMLIIWVFFWVSELTFRAQIRDYLQSGKKPSGDRACLGFQL